MTTELNWKVINEPLHFHLTPSKVISLLHSRWFGISLLRVLPDDHVGPAPQEVALHNHTWSQIRLMVPGRLSESVCKLGSTKGLVTRKVGFFSVIRADTFLGERSVSRPTWVLVLNGRAHAVSGKLFGYSYDSNQGQAHFEPTFVPPEDKIAPPQIVS